MALGVRLDGGGRCWAGDLRMGGVGGLSRGGEVKNDERFVGAGARG